MSPEDAKRVALLSIQIHFLLSTLPSCLTLTHESLSFLNKTSKRAIYYRFNEKVYADFIKRFIFRVLLLTR